MRNVFTRYFLGIVTLMLVTSGVWADTLDNELGSSSAADIPIDFNPDDYSFIVYDYGSKDNLGNDTDIVAAMDSLFDYRPNVDYTYKTINSTPITVEDLNNHDIFIVGWNEESTVHSLSQSIIEDGILGRVILTGHDADFHTVGGVSNAYSDYEPADRFLAQSIEYILQGTGTGMLALGDVRGFPWIPNKWEIVAQINAGDDVSSFTVEGENSGVFDDLEPEYMDGWKASYHNTFDSWGESFVPFELNEYEANGEEIIDTITIAADVYPFERLGFTKDFTIIDHDNTGTDCCDPNDEIEYTICWDNIDSRTFEDVTIVDVLPYSVDYDFDPFDTSYNIMDNTYTWNIGTLDPNNLTGCVSLTVRVNETAPAGMFIHNKAYIYTGDILIGIAEVDTPVCCWQTEDADIIYVDKNAIGFDTGISWTHAYTDLQDALTRAREANCSATGYKIYVAEGIYNPGNGSALSFELPYETEMYGGFKKGGCDFADRNPDKYKTILTGEIGDNIINDTVVTMGDDCIIDGFVVEHGNDYGVYGNNSDCEINNCYIKESQYGIRIINGNISLQWSKIANNILHGIRHEGASNALSILNSISSQNGGHGVYVENSSLILKNSVITKNGNNEELRYGIRIIDPNEPPVLYNNTIAYNYNEGLSYVKSDPNIFADVQNCIIYYNNDGGEQMSGIEYPEYCCIYDPVNDPNGLDYIDYGDGNVSGKPMFAYFGDPNNIHLAYNSELIDRGNISFTNSEIGYEDIDSENRIEGSWIDIGADEAYSCDDDLSEDDIYNERDLNGDGVVSLYEFALMSEAWLTNSPNNPAYVADPNSFPSNYCDNWNEACNLYVDYKIDISDLTLFTPEWLWTACWKDSYDSRFENVTAPLGGEALMMVSMSLSLDTTSSITSVEETTIDEQTEKENLAMLVLAIYQLMDILDEQQSNPSPDFAIEDIDAEKAKLEEILWEMYNDYYSIDYKKTKKDKSK